MERKNGNFLLLVYLFLYFLHSSVPYVIGQVLDTISKLATAEEGAELDVSEETLSKYHYYFIITLTLLTFFGFFRTILMQLYQ